MHKQARLRRTATKSKHVQLWRITQRVVRKLQSETE
jgi:hypothetical protein